MPLDRAAVAKLRRKHLAGLHGVAVAMTGQAKQLATRHTDNGTRRNSVTQTRRTADVLWGIPLASAPHAAHLELGFRPHWVHGRHIGLWMQRHGVGVQRFTTSRSGRKITRKQYRSVRAVALGLYVGGPGSRLQTGPGGTGGRLRRGRRTLTRHWHTKGGSSRYLPSGKVGHPILQPVAANVRQLDKQAFLRGFARG